MPPIAPKRNGRKVGTTDLERWVSGLVLQIGVLERRLAEVEKELRDTRKIECRLSEPDADLDSSIPY